MSFEIDYGDLPESYTSNDSSATITFHGELRWRIPWRTQVRWFVDLVWTKGWAAVWQDGLWWREMSVKVETR